METLAITMQPVESSQIAAIGHDAATNVLAILFASKTGSGSTYHYQNFTADDFAAFAGAESVGSYFGKHIKPFAEKYPFARIEAPAPDDTEARRVRLQGIADEAMATARALPSSVAELMAATLPRPESACARDARIDSGVDDYPSDDDILDIMLEQFGLHAAEAIERLAKFDFAAARAKLECVA